MIIHKAYKFRIYPNDTQKEIIHKTFGCTRFIYNYYLDMKQTEYKNNHQSKSAYECIKDIPTLYIERPYLKEIDSMSLRCALFDLDDAYKAFYKGIRKYPNFKRKYDKNSYRTNRITSTYKGKQYENIILDLEKKTITLPKLKEMKIRGYRNLSNIQGRIINATVSREKTGKYYVSVLYEQNIETPKFIPNSIIGIDLGIKDVVITSDNEKYNNQKNIQKYEKRIKRKQRELSRKQKGSNNYYKCKQQLARLYSKLKNARIHITHEITKKLTDTYDMIVTETLKIKNMVKNHKLAKSLTDVTLGENIRQLEYKSKWKGKRLYKVDTYYPSSQICSVCGYQNKITKDLSVRKYICPECHSELDRDYNASVNILFEGLKQYMKELV